MSEGKRGLRAHERDTGRRDREMDGGRTKDGLRDWEERRDDRRSYQKEGKRRKWVRQADREWRLLQLDTAD